MPVPWEKYKKKLQDNQSAQSVSTNVSGNKSQIPRVRRDYSLPEALLTGVVNTPSSIWGDVVKPLGGFVTDPATTFGGMMELGKEAITYNPFSPKSNYPRMSAIATDFSNRNGSWENFKRGIAEHPAMALQDASMLFGGLGAGAKASGLGRLAEGLNIASKFTDPITAPLRFAGKTNEVVGKVANRFEGSALQPTFEKEKGLKVFERKINTALKDNYAPTKKGLLKLEEDLKNLNNSASAIANDPINANKTITLQSVVDMLDEQLKKVENKATRGDYEKAVNDVLERFSNLKNYNDFSKPIPLSDAIHLKSSFGNLASGKFDQSMKPAQANIALYKKVENTMLEELGKQDPRLIPIGLKQRDLIELRPEIEATVAGQKKAGMLSWKTGRAAAAGLMGQHYMGLPGAVAFASGEYMLDNPFIKHKIAVGLDRASSVVDKLGNVAKSPIAQKGIFSPKASMIRNTLSRLGKTENDYEKMKQHLIDYNKQNNDSIDVDSPSNILKMLKDHPELIQ